MSVRSRSQAVGVGVAPAGVGLESRLAQVLTIGLRTFGHQTDATGMKHGSSGRAADKTRLEELRHLRESRKWDDDYDAWTPVIRIKGYGTVPSRGRGVSAKCRLTLTWRKMEGRRVSLAEAVAEVMLEWLSCEMQDGGCCIAGSGAPSVMSKDPNGPTALNDVEIFVQADESGAAMATSMVAKIVELIDPNEPVALAPDYFDNVPKSDFLPCFEEVVYNEYPTSEESGSGETDED